MTHWLDCRLNSFVALYTVLDLADLLLTWLTCCSGLPGVSYADESRRTVTTSLESGACTFIPDIVCAAGSGHHVLVVCITRCDGSAFSILSESNNGEEKNMLEDGGFLGFMSCDQDEVDEPREHGRAQMGLVEGHVFMSGCSPLTMGVDYAGCDRNGRGRNYGALKQVKSESHSIRFDLFRGRSDTRVCDIAVDGCKSYASLPPTVRSLAITNLALLLHCQQISSLLFQKQNLHPNNVSFRHCFFSPSLMPHSYPSSREGSGRMIRDQYASHCKTKTASEAKADFFGKCP
jgi:hypothetical protein